MHTMQVQPGRCLGCLVVAPADKSKGLTRLSPKIARLARASSPEGSGPWDDLLTLRFLESAKFPGKKKDSGILILIIKGLKTNS